MGSTNRRMRESSGIGRISALIPRIRIRLTRLVPTIFPTASPGLGLTRSVDADGQLRHARAYRHHGQANQMGVTPSRLARRQHTSHDRGSDGFHRKIYTQISLCMEPARGSVAESDHKPIQVIALGNRVPAHSGRTGRHDIMGQEPAQKYVTLQDREWPARAPVVAVAEAQ